MRLAGAEPETHARVARLRRDAPPTSATWSSAGRRIVADGPPQLAVDVPGELAATIKGVCPCDAGVLIDNIGTLVTNDPELGEGRSGSSTTPRWCSATGVVQWAGPQRPIPEAAADERFDAGGRAVIPGFVDSHAHLVFAGDRTRGVRRAHGRASRTAPAGSDDRRRDARGDRRGSSTPTRPARRRGAALRHDDDRVQVGLRPDRRATSAAACEVAGRHTTRRRTSARTSSRPSTRTPRRLRRAGHGPDARRVRAARALDRRLLRARRLRRRPGARDPRGRHRARGSCPRVHANQLGHGPGVQLAVELGAASADHVTHVTDADVDALAKRRHGRDAAARRRVLDPRAPTPMRAGCSTRA